jgi:predicted ester cyclase
MEFLENATTAFPDCTLNIDHILADEKGEVASQCTFKGTNLGDMVMNENTVAGLRSRPGDQSRRVLHHSRG